jgi:hypothetical protein
MDKYHSGGNVTVCNICSMNFNMKNNPEDHTQLCHVQPDSDALNPVLQSNIEDDENLEVFSDIVQVDGNTTIPDENDFTWVGLSSLQFPSIQERRSLFEPRGQEDQPDITMIDISEPPLAGHSRDITYKYSLNSHNQSRRLITGAQKPPLSFTYNNIKIVDDIQYAHNVNIELNSGVYLSAIKPVLETLNVGWSTELDNWIVTCTKMSNREDSTSVHLLCTVLTLLITSKDMTVLVKHQVTLHFYHTKDKIQVQGSTILSPGISSASWLAKHLIEPLAARHMENNQHAIDQINNDIMSSVSTRPTTCNYLLFIRDKSKSNSCEGPSSLLREMQEDVPQKVYQQESCTWWELEQGCLVLPCLHLW